MASPTVLLFCLLQAFAVYMAVTNAFEDGLTALGDDSVYRYHMDDLDAQQLQLRQEQHFLRKRDTTEDELKKKNQKETTKKQTQLDKASTKPVKLAAAKQTTGDTSSSSSSSSSSTPLTTPLSTLHDSHYNHNATSMIDEVNHGITNVTDAEIPEFPIEEIDKLPKHVGNATMKQVSYIYYNASTRYNMPDISNYWVEMSQLSDSNKHDMLSNAHRRAATIQLSFKFPFYGHPVENVTIATGGFLFLGDAVHTWLAATQYIAPLMANFNTSISNHSSIYYYDNGTAFTVQWNNVWLQDSKHKAEPESIDSSFAFQATLHSNGDIVFVYKRLPIPIHEITEEKHPVKVGMSDAYIYDRTIFFIRRKTIYEYHKAELKKEDLTNNTVIYFAAIPTCNMLTDCNSCVAAKISFDCQWCGEIGRCSDGFDRHRQSWLLKQCETFAVTKCNADKNSTSAGTTLEHASSSHSSMSNQPLSSSSSSASGSGSSSSSAVQLAGKDAHHTSRMQVLSLLVLITMCCGLGFWTFYAYKNPQSSSGQFLIKYRPTQWRFGNSEARYTAASIHI